MKLFFLVFALLFTVIVFAQIPPEECLELAQPMLAIEPTPMGASHVGSVEPGDSVQIRLPVPAESLLGYWVQLSNAVAFTGQGSAYQLIIHRDSASGPVIYEGPVIANGDAWNGDNARPISLISAITAQDQQSGYLDLWITAQVDGDTWTLYRQDAGRQISALVAKATPEIAAAIKSARAMKERQISIIPLPRQITLAEGDFILTPQTRIVWAQDAPASVAFAGSELQAYIQERTGVMLQAMAVTAPTKGDIALGIENTTAWPVLSVDGNKLPGDGYRILANADGVKIVGAGVAGCLYGAMTVGQMSAARNGNPCIPHCQIVDEPAFPARIIQYDVARGQTIDVKYVKRMIREFARVKINGLLFYFEDDFRFKAYPFLGREGTMTHEKAAELTAFARPYQMQLIPQFESLGHAANVLWRPELAHLREAGDPTNFCTMNPQTWEFLDTVIGELVEAFPNSTYIHTGGDEFEYAFGKCPLCQERIKEIGIGGLYAEHMQKLNDLVKKHGRVMMFWPSHWGPTADLTQMSLKNKDLMPLDSIPTEWIYHGPPAYPEIKQYQDAGYMDVFCCPAVESYSRLWPDHTTTFRGIRGFYQAGAEQGCGGAYCTTWEFMHGALIENSWYGLVYAAECSWSPNTAMKPEYDRRFADQWWGIKSPDAAKMMSETISDPLLADSKSALFRHGMLLQQIYWVSPTNVVREYMMRQQNVMPAIPVMVEQMTAALERLDEFDSQASRNELTLRSTRLAFKMMKLAGEKLLAFENFTRLYAEAEKIAGTEPLEAAQLIREIVSGHRDLATAYAQKATEYDYFVQNCGAYAGDVTRMRGLVTAFEQNASALEELVSQLETTVVTQLPDGGKFGLRTGICGLAGHWLPEMLSEENADVSWDVTAFVKAGPMQVEMLYDRGAHALNIEDMKIICDGEVVAQDKHFATTGAAHSNNVYNFTLDEIIPGAKYELVATVRGSGGVDSYGSVWFITPE